MFFNLQISRTLVKKEGRMSESRKIVSEDALNKEWIEIQAAQANKANFKPLYNRYFEQIFRFIYKRTADENLASDICSQVFLKALQKLDKYQNKGVPFSAWLYRIASNEVTQHFRNTQKERVVSLETKQITGLMEASGFDTIAFENTTEETRLNKIIQQLDQLSETDLQLIEMRFFELRPFKEIAEILEITESNAKVKTYRILERLKKRIEKDRHQ